MCLEFAECESTVFRRSQEFFPLLFEVYRITKTFGVNVVLRRWGILQDNLVLSTGLIM